ncbi:MAG: C4-type zinc ribbon domain-containing protein [Bacteroidales bacterium]|nr:C4-type zinc ribbon domain-containing protein [Bacteroidales bacterium]
MAKSKTPDKKVTEKVKAETKKTDSKAKTKPKQKEEVSNPDNVILVENATVKKNKSDDSEGARMLKKLQALYNLQHIDTKIINLKKLRGMLPVEVKDLEDSIEGLKIRVEKIKDEVKVVEQFIANKNIEIKDCLSAIKKYESQKDNVKNNREYESLTNQIHNKSLDIQLLEKEIRQAKDKLVIKTQSLETVESDLEVYKNEYKVKVNELDEIIAETTKDEEELKREAKEHEAFIDERLLTAYNRIKSNAKNGLAVVPIERDACGGCFNKIPMQRRLDIRIQKRTIVCEYCGRILIDPKMFDDNFEE